MRKINHIIRRRPGFSLIEVIIAIFVVGVGFLAAASMQGTSVSGNSKGKFMTEATYLAQDQLENLKQIGFDNVVTGADAGTLNGRGQIVANGAYTRSWQVTNNSPVTLMKSITVTVTWQERGVNHSLTMATVINSQA